MIGDEAYDGYVTGLRNAHSPNSSMSIGMTPNIPHDCEKVLRKTYVLKLPIALALTCLAENFAAQSVDDSNTQRVRVRPARQSAFVDWVFTLW